ncbi:hydroxyisourate hydrolase [Flammeovirga pectinis]|uniref:5-hydroxyisourate hydrolase n=1 Tax=Flammeovirga pectinis TaxID=2494373 RepID=A0A3S9P5Q4_9BACT|nr:hydroxyisourate hydrolase [Flammeovirga pectinis]AZQ63536.1 hydroxyisourate hydrolase [Flammeovirga pectinis]
MKNFITGLLILLYSGISYSQESYQLSSHILDVTKGAPAQNVKIKLEKLKSDKSWISIDQKVTDENGRIKDFLKSTDKTNHKGIYKLTYFVSPYFKKQGIESFYPFIEVVFEIKDDKHYHVPITLSAFGYSTYRGN